MFEDVDNEKEIDPYGEENWEEKSIELDRDRMISDIIDDMMENPHDYIHFIRDTLSQSLIDYSDEELKQLLGDRDDEECEECDGSGLIDDDEDGYECPECNGTGYIDYYEVNYKK